MSGAEACLIPEEIKLFCTASDNGFLSIVVYGGSVLPSGLSVWEQDEEHHCSFTWPGWRCSSLSSHVPPCALLNVWAHLKACVCQADLSALSLVAFTKVPCDRCLSYAWPFHATDSSMLCSASESTTIYRDIFLLSCLRACIHTRWELDKRKLGLSSYVKVQK